jgi:hypothetical protein
MTRLLAFLRWLFAPLPTTPERAAAERAYWMAAR